jgi:hypothetical protein
MKRLALAIGLLAVCADRASAAPITWSFDTTLRLSSIEFSLTCPTAMQPYLPLHDTSVHGTLTFDSTSLDSNPDPTIGIYRMGIWTLEVPVFGTTWTSLAGSLEVGTVDAPTLGAFMCHGCLAAFGYFSANNSNPAAPPAPGGALPFEFRTFGPQFVTDALPSGLAPFMAAGGFFVGASDIHALPFEVHAVPEPGLFPLAASGAGLLLARLRLRRVRTRRADGLHVSP